MSMEAYALCSKEISSFQEWQAAIDEFDFSIELHFRDKISESQGYLPATWQGLEAGFECSKFSFSELAEVYPRIDFGRPWPFAYAFYFHTLTGCVGTWFALAACVKLTGGIAYDPQAGRLLSADDAIHYARKTEAGFHQIKHLI